MSHDTFSSGHDENRQSAREQDPAPATLSTPTSFTEQQASVARCEDAAGAAASRRTVGDSCAYFLSSTVVVPAVLDDPEGQPMTTSERRHEEEGSLNLQQWHEADAAGSSGVRRVNGALSGGDNHGQERRHGAGREQAGGICVAKSGTDEAGSAKAWYDSTTAPAAGSGGEGAGGNHAAAAIVDRAAAGGSSSIVSSTKEIAASYNGHDPPSHFRTQQKGEEDREASSDVYPQEGADEALSPKPDPDITRNGSASPTRATSLTNAHHSNIFAGSTDIYSSERGTSINHASAGDYVETAKVRNLRNGGDREIEEQGNWVKGDGVVLDESKTGKKNTRSDDDIDEETSSFVKDDDGSGSDDEFGEAVVTHLGELQRQRSFEQHERVERRREMGVGIASVPRKTLARTRLLSVEHSAALEMTLALEMAATAAPVHGEEEADREEEHRLTMLNMTRGDLADLFDFDDKSEDVDGSKPSFTEHGNKGECNMADKIALSDVKGSANESQNNTRNEDDFDEDTERIDGNVLLRTTEASQVTQTRDAGAVFAAATAAASPHRLAGSGKGEQKKLVAAPDVGPEDALAAGRRRRSTYFINADKNGEHAASRLRRTSRVMSLDEATTAVKAAAAAAAAAGAFNASPTRLSGGSTGATKNGNEPSTGTTAAPAAFHRRSLSGSRVLEQGQRDVVAPRKTSSSRGEKRYRGDGGESTDGTASPGREGGEGGEGEEEAEAEVMEAGERSGDVEEGSGEADEGSGDGDGDGVRDENTRVAVRKPKGFGPIVMNTSQCEYTVVRECARELGWHLCETKFSANSDPLMKKDRTTAFNPHTTADASYACTHGGMCNRLWNVMWHDHGNFEEQLRGLQTFQSYSHLPGLSFFARKAGLALLMSRMYQEAPKEYRFYPETWVLPAEMNAFRAEFGANGKSSSVFIVKPDSGCQGKGIFLTKKVDSVLELPGKSVAQRYLPNPMLIDGYKFDLRLYVLVTSVNPMRIFLFDDGLVRICTEPYEAPTANNIDKTTMHLTNYSVNKASTNFTSDDTGEGGFKRSIKWFKKWLEEQGHDSAALWGRLADACVKTLITVGPMLRREYNAMHPTNSPSSPRGGGTSTAGKGGTPLPPPLSRSTCFTIIGMDLMIDDQLNPWIIEINHLPSFRTETAMDYRIKKELVFHTLSLLDVRVGARENWRAEMESLKRARLLGLPPKGDVGGAGQGGSGEGGRNNAPGGSKHSRKKQRSRLATERVRDGFEAMVKGGFERVFPPSQTAPNVGVNYAKVVRVAEEVFSTLWNYCSTTSRFGRAGSPPRSATRSNRSAFPPQQIGSGSNTPPTNERRLPRTRDNPTAASGELLSASAMHEEIPRTRHDDVDTANSLPGNGIPSGDVTPASQDDNVNDRRKAIGDAHRRRGRRRHIVDNSSSSSNSSRGRSSSTESRDGADESMKQVAGRRATSGTRDSDALFTATATAITETPPSASADSTGARVPSTKGINNAGVEVVREWLAIDRVEADTNGREDSNGNTREQNEEGSSSHPPAITPRPPDEHPQQDRPDPDRASSPLQPRKRRSSRNRNNKGRPRSLSPARRRRGTRGGSAGGRDWEKEAKRRKKLYTGVANVANVGGAWVGSGVNVGVKVEVGVDQGESAFVDGVMQPERVDGRWGENRDEEGDSVIDLGGEGCRAQQKQSLMRRSEQPGWMVSQNIDGQKSNFDPKPTAPTENGRAAPFAQRRGNPVLWRGMGSILRVVSPFRGEDGHRCAGAAIGNGTDSGLPEGCGLRPIAIQTWPRDQRQEQPAIATASRSNAVNQASSPRSGGWPARAPFRPSGTAAIYSPGDQDTKLPPWRFSRSKVGDLSSTNSSGGGGGGGVEVERWMSKAERLKTNSRTETTGAVASGGHWPSPPTVLIPSRLEPNAFASRVNVGLMRRDVASPRVGFAEAGGRENKARFWPCDSTGTDVRNRDSARLFASAAKTANCSSKKRRPSTGKRPESSTRGGRRAAAGKSRRLVSASARGRSEGRGGGMVPLIMPTVSFCLGDE